MAQAKLLLDTNVVIDYLNEREPFYEKARLLMIGGRVGEFELWISSSQVTDLIYILSDGERSEMDAVMGQLRGLRTFVNVLAASEREVDLMLAASWCDPEDYLLYEIALALRADALITRNQHDFPQGLVPVMGCDEFFQWMRDTRGLDYGEVEL
ncbi:PIN domain-containing protein [Adlercreutzia sp. R7]|uniref:PIN domain-containing protein n=1 Tax=Adlercreutzia wanghongyangiae TaxID=3111451 RepID=A0ABU6IGU5_9ACTN|nr:PIN domain-containing protein [Adlercreutzia sp. R7]